VKQLRFEVAQGRSQDLVDVPFADVERLIGELAVLGSEGETQRSPELARALHEAISRDPAPPIQITDHERADVLVALDRIGLRSGLSGPLIELRGACADVD
jgi:hypothetical protein